MDRRAVAAIIRERQHFADIAFQTSGEFSFHTPSSHPEGYGFTVQSLKIILMGGGDVKLNLKKLVDAFPQSPMTAVTIYSSFNYLIYQRKEYRSDDILPNRNITI